MDDQNKKPEQWNPFGYPENDDNDSSRQDRYDSARTPSEPYSFGPFGQAFGSSSDGRPIEPVRAEQPEVVQPVREYRPFTVSGGGGGRGSWGTPPPAKRGASLRAMFASFLVGVVAVGALMFAADRGDWFSTQALNGSSGAVTNESPAPSGETVSNEADVVRPNNIAKIFEQASPAVVKIETYAKAQSRGGTLDQYYDDFFSQFFGDDWQRDGSGGEQNEGGDLQQSGAGSGFIFDSTGYILTNQHVIADADEIKVTVIGHSEPFTAKLLGSSYDLDLAVLKIEGSDFPTLKLGNSGDINMGDWVVAIGNPYGFDHTITVGVLSANEREISIQDSDGTRNYQHLLQTDAAINPGNSGGPLINLQGEVIGINTAVSSQAQGIGFAIPTSTITEVLDNLKNNTEIPKEPVPFIGANLYNNSQEIADRLGIDTTTGAFVQSVVFGSPAYKADLRQYDVITGLDGKSYKTREEIIAEIQKRKVGDKVTLNVIRGERTLDIVVEIGDRNEFESIE